MGTAPSCGRPSAPPRGHSCGNEPTCAGHRLCVRRPRPNPRGCGVQWSIVTTSRTASCRRPSCRRRSQAATRCSVGAACPVSSEWRLACQSRRRLCRCVLAPPTSQILACQPFLSRGSLQRCPVLLHTCWHLAPSGQTGASSLIFRLATKCLSACAASPDRRGSRKEPAPVPPLDSSERRPSSSSSVSRSRFLLASEAGFPQCPCRLCRGSRM